MGWTSGFRWRVEGVRKVRNHRKRNIIPTILGGAVLAAILTCCSCSDRFLTGNPPNAQSPVSTPAPSETPENTPAPAITHDAAKTDDVIDGTVPSAPAEPSASAAMHSSPGDPIEQGKDSLPYYREENAERYEQYSLENPEMDFAQAVVYVNIGLDRGFYEDIKPAENIYSLYVLVNKTYKLPDDFKPELIKLSDSLCVPGKGEQHLRKEASEAFTKMSEDAKKEGLNIQAYGTYRSISVQNDIWNNAIKSGRTREDVDSLNARGGHSEHHTGLAVDVIRNNYSVADTPEYAWYKDKAHEYGFIVRYPEGKEHITGYKHEPWHLRYVGPEIAMRVYESGLTYEEFTIGTGSLEQMTGRE
jgi:D-alanyl-D-alanine carboxypeptidase